MHTKLTQMRQILPMVACMVMSLSTFAQRVIVVEKNNAQSLLNAIGKANELNADLAAERLFILIPNGFYDLGETVLTRISGHNVALIGESMTGVIIQNKPDVKIESISKTAVFQ